MVRPLSAVREGVLRKGWRYLILDGYVDEPASLGVPPFISPQVRSLAGGLVNGGAGEGEIGYLTVDQWRGIRGRGEWSPEGRLEFVIAVKGCVVPGKYLRGTPISEREVGELRESLKDTAFAVWGAGSGPTGVSGDPGVLGRNVASEGIAASRERSIEEWNEDLGSGSFIIGLHPDFPYPLIAEIETSRGCPRYLNGGCSFCIEPAKGPVQYREAADIISEVEALAEHGLENIRIGGQSDLVSYLSEETGISDSPAPNVEALSEMMSGTRTALHSGKGVRSAVASGRRTDIETGIVHTDNANPAVIADHPEEARSALQAIASNCTGGSVLALGLESSDPAVREANNLNSDASQSLAAIRAINEVGKGRGENGMPRLLPGINFLGGLKGQTMKSFDDDIAFLREVASQGQLLRRINIRAAMFPLPGGGSGASFADGRTERAFRAFKERVRAELDPWFLGQVAPVNGSMKGVYIETALGKAAYGRQIGSYPILVRIDHPDSIGTFCDVCVTGISSRSVSGFRSPFMINRVPFSHLQAIPGIGKRRSASVFRRRPVDERYLREDLGIDGPLLKHIATDQ